MFSDIICDVLYNALRVDEEFFPHPPRGNTIIYVVYFY